MQTITIDTDVVLPLNLKEPYIDLRDRAEAACNTITFLHAAGLELNFNGEARDIAAQLIHAYARNATKTSKAVTEKRASKMTPATLLLVGKILNDFGHKVADNAAQIRHLVTNKLIEETDDSDPKVRLKALELLGKISDVGLFSDKTEVTITHQTSDELKQQLRAKLEKLVNPKPEEDDGPVIIDGEIRSLDDILGRTNVVKYRNA